MKNDENKNKNDENKKKNRNKNKKKIIRKRTSRIRMRIRVRRVTRSINILVIFPLLQIALSSDNFSSDFYFIF